MKRYLLLSTVALAWVICSCGPSAPPSAPHDLLQQAPEPADRPQLNGQLTTIPAPGKVTVIDFWATFCEPCLTEMPELERYWRTADKARLQVIGISLDDDSYVVEQKLAELGITFPQIIDDGHVLKGRYLVDSIPAAFVVDRQGRIRYYASAATYHAKDVLDAAEAVLAE
jgi:peroxiredoxin